MRDFEKALQIWKQIVPTALMVQFFNVNLEEWISLNLKSIVTTARKWRNTWAFTCHTLWCWSNKDMHDNSFLRPLDAVQYILHNSVEYEFFKKCNKKVTEKESANRMEG